MTASVLTQATVASVMSDVIIDCPPEATAAYVASTMARSGVHCVIVRQLRPLAAGDEPFGWGIVSDLDLMRALGAAAERPIGELAGTEIVTVEPGDTLEHAAQLMAEHETAHLVVVSPETALPVGVISTLDVARAAMQDEMAA